MLHLLYILAFTGLAILAVGNLIRSLITLSTESQRTYLPTNWDQNSPGSPTGNSQYRRVPHPELLDDRGNILNEPLLVMKSMTVEDARQKLDELYDSSPNGSSGPQEQA